MDSIKGAGLRCLGVGVSNGLTVWVVGLFVVSVLVGYQESDAAKCGFDTGGFVDLLWDRDGGSFLGSCRWLVYSGGIVSSGLVFAVEV